MSIEKSGVVGFAVHGDHFELAAERALSGERSADAVKHAEIGVFENEPAIERRSPRVAALPRAERA